MTNYAHQRFLKPLQLLEGILKISAGKKDHGSVFYKNKGRDVLFRLEALCRIYRNIHDKKVFDNWYKEFKMLEDLLGQIDYNEALQIEFNTDKKLKNKSDKLFGQNCITLTEALTLKLKNDGWLSGEKTQLFRSALETCSWQESHEDRSSYAREMSYEITKLQTKYETGELNPFLIEEGLHEFRRRLRWIGIYSIASEGMVQLTKVKTISTSLQKYQTKDIINSPYNLMPKAAKGQHLITIQSQHFYAMSWLIQQLGNWKDSAHRHEGLILLGAETSKAEQAQIAELPTKAEIAIDDFIYNDHVIMKLNRDILRSIA